MVAMMQSIVLLLVGFVLLIKGADFFVEGSSSVQGRADSVYDCRTHDRCNGDEPAGTCCQCNSFRCPVTMHWQSAM